MGEVICGTLQVSVTRHGHDEGHGRIPRRAAGEKTAPTSAHHKFFDMSTEIACGQTERDAHQKSRNERDSSDNERDARTEDDPAEYVAPDVVCPQQVP